MRNIRPKIAMAMTCKIYHHLHEATLQISDRMMFDKEGVGRKVKELLINNIAHSTVPFRHLRKSTHDA